MKRKTKKAIEAGGLGLLGYLVGGLATYGIIRAIKGSTPSTTGKLAGVGSAPKVYGFVPTIVYSTIVGSINRLVSEKGAEISRASIRTNVPAWLLTIIAAKEIQFFPYTRTNTTVLATGPGQITPLTFFDMFYIAKTWGLVSSELETYLKQTMGGYWPRFYQLAMNREADKTAGLRLLKNTELNLTMAGLHLACLIRLFGGTGLHTNAARVVLGYNRGIAWSLRGTAKSMGLKESQLITLVAKPGWAWPSSLALTPTQLQATVSATEAKNYIADHLAPGGYFDQAKRLGLTNSGAI